MHRTRIIAFGIALATLLSLVAFSRPASAQDVETLFREGSDALSNRDFETAYDRLSKAWVLRQSVDVAANLSVAERRTGRNRDAAEHIAFAIANFPPAGNQDVKRDLEVTLAELKKGLAEVTVETEDGAAVSWGDKGAGRAPLATPIYLEPGTHTLRAELGDRKGSITLKVTEGSSERVAIKLTKSADAAPTDKPKVEPQPSEPRAMWPAALIGSIGGAALATGIGLTVAAELENAEADRIAEEDCSPVTNTCVADGQAKLDNWALFHNISFGMYGLAAAAGLGLGLYLGLPQDESASEPEATAVPWIGPGLMGGSVVGRF